MHIFSAKTGFLPPITGLLTPLMGFLPPITGLLTPIMGFLPPIILCEEIKKATIGMTVAVTRYSKQ